LLLAHGSPLSTDEYVTAQTAKERWATFARVAGGPVATVCLGHTHQPMDEVHHGIRYLNPGSVGWPKDGDGRASYGILSFGPPAGVVHFATHRVASERDAFVDRAVGAGLPAPLAEAMATGRSI
jgi:predicted phosphodiesterase